jgi:hypothetical protein
MRLRECLATGCTLIPLQPVAVFAIVPAFDPAIVARHLALAFRQAMSQNDSGYQPCLWRKPEVKPHAQLALYVGLQWSGGGGETRTPAGMVLEAPGKPVHPQEMKARLMAGLLSVRAYVLVARESSTTFAFSCFAPVQR